MGMIRWRIETGDRIGMTLDVVRVLTEHACNIEAMQVMRHYIYVKLDGPRGFDFGPVQAQLLQTDGVRVVAPVDKLPAEERESQLLRDTFKSRADDIAFDDILHQSDLMKRCIQTAKLVARADSTVLLLGESGTGKELFARAIHNSGKRDAYAFVAINCASLPEHLLESELFGYEEGAFSGSKKGGKPGLYELADKGTLFLDEVGELPLPLQAKLLRTLQTGTFRRVGGTREQKANVRVIAATNRDLMGMVRSGEFREDLYYRLHVIPVQIPPLRSRPEDVLLLANHFLDNWRSKLVKPGLHFAAACRKALSKYDFPGNVRELENMVERAVHLTDEDAIESYHMMIPSPGGGARGIRTVEGRSLKEQVEAFERELLGEYLERYDSLRTIAKRLGTSHTTVINKVRRYGLTQERKE
ncbi:MAG TPA: sigma 54-interacting transcriptional regulator [Bacilli bacterium]|nr:sigma 54-interacting transcriptional regulator [Bacilli bacterium]